jgi:hypothetical protein
MPRACPVGYSRSRLHKELIDKDAMGLSHGHSRSSLRLSNQREAPPGEPVASIRPASLVSFAGLLVKQCIDAFDNGGIAAFCYQKL